MDPDWAVLQETEFRASALRGHPLDNSMFTAIALFVAFSVRMPVLLRIFSTLLFTLSLVAFGGRIGLLFSLFGMLVLGCHIAWKRLTSGHVTLMEVLLGLMAFMVAPILLLGGVWFAIESPMGERILSHAVWDDSADSRRLALSAWHFLSAPEMLLGVSTERISDIDDRMQLLDIENPWLLMCLYLGVVMFPLWLTGMLAFIRRLTRNQPLALILAVAGYFVIASTSNSFGRKDSTYAIMVVAVCCASRVLMQKSRQDAD